MMYISLILAKANRKYMLYTLTSMVNKTST